MKKIYRTLLIVLCMAAVIFTMPVSAKESVSDGKKADGETLTTEKKEKNGWYTLKKGKKYYKDGKYLTGLQKIGSKTYFFNSLGYMKTGTVTVGKRTYYLNDKGVLRARKIGNVYIDGSGKRMDKARKEVFKAEQNARDVIKSVTNSKMTKSQKLRACFNWVMKKNYWSWRQLSQCNVSYWTAYYANDHFERGKGDCHADACAFAYLAKELGYKNVYVCTDGKKSTKNTHSWTEINGRVYDPLFAQAKSFSRNYGVKYGVYKLYPIMRTKI